MDQATGSDLTSGEGADIDAAGLETSLASRISLAPVAHRPGSISGKTLSRRSISFNRPSCATVNLPVDAKVCQMVFTSLN